MAQLTDYMEGSSSTDEAIKALEHFSNFLNQYGVGFYESDIYAPDGSTFYDKIIEEVWG